MTIALLIAQTITGAVGVAAVLVVRGALRDVTSVFDRVEERAFVERHTLHGRIQRPELFPVRPVQTSSQQEPSEVTQASDAAAFEAAGGSVEDASPAELAALFGERFGDR